MRQVRNRLTPGIRRQREESVDDTTDAVLAVACIGLVRPLVVPRDSHGFISVNFNRPPLPPFL